jgi:hypothetical protein
MDVQKEGGEAEPIPTQRTQSAADHQLHKLATIMNVQRSARQNTLSEFKKFHNQEPAIKVCESSIEESLVIPKPAKEPDFALSESDQERMDVYLKCLEKGYDFRQLDPRHVEPGRIPFELAQR